MKAKMKNKTYKKLQLNDKIERKQNFYKRNKNEIRNGSSMYVKVR